MRQELVAGDTLSFDTQVPEFPPSGGWTLTYKLIPRVSGAVISFANSSVDGDKYVFQVGASTTAGWAVGDYTVAAYVSKAGERYTVEGFAPDDHQTTKILPDPALVPAYDGRSHARKVLDAIEAVIENRASQTQREMVAYTIGSRSQQLDAQESKAALLELRSKYKWLVSNEDAREALAAGLPNPRDVRVRFGNP